MPDDPTFYRIEEAVEQALAMDWTKQKFVTRCREEWDRVVAKKREELQVRLKKLEGR